MFLLNDVTVDPSGNRIYRKSTWISLEPMVMKVLLALTQHPRRVLTKEELMRKVWWDSYPSQSVLPRAITELRKALGDHASSPRFIETIYKKGYRLMVTPETLHSYSGHDFDRCQGTASPKLGSALEILIFAALFFWITAASWFLCPKSFHPKMSARDPGPPCNSSFPVTLPTPNQGTRE